MENVEVKISKIQGKGVFAKRDFKKGETVLKIDDIHVVIDYSKLKKHQREFQSDYFDDKVVLM